MSLIEYIKVDDHSEIGILDLKLFLEQLKSSHKRDIEREGTLFLLSELMEGADEAMYYDEFGKPHLRDMGRFMSLTHSHDKLAIILNKTEPTGIDIELIRNKVMNVKHKFLQSSELELLKNSEVEKHLVYWAAKETLYKIHGRRKVDFVKDLSIEPFEYRLNGGDIKGRIALPDFNKTYLLHYQKKEEYILVYMIKESEKLA